MQLEAGKKYTDRRGRVYGPIIKTGSLFWGEHAETPLWNHDGTIDRISRDMDLVAEYVEPAPVESPDDWVEITDPKHVLRDTDQMTSAGNISGEYVGQCEGRGGWIPCQTLGRTGEALGCNKWARARCLRKDLPKVESPDDWVIQDRVPAREGIDFGWNVSAKDFDVYVPDDRWKWSISGSYTGRMHGSYGGRMHGSYGNMSRLAVFCRRKDLPPVPPVVDPGEGYRLLADDEITLSTDERAYVWEPDDRTEWDTLKEANSREFVGVTVASLLVDRPNMAVRRKLSPATRTIVLKEWICWDDDYPDSVAIAWRSSSPSDGKFTEYDHAHPTGNTRTVEIPVT